MQLNLPEIHKISADDMKKIFPSKYYSKYEHHTKIIEHEQNVLNDSRNGKDDLNLKSKNRQVIPEVPLKKQYNPRFQNYQSTIVLNKQQVTRLNKYKKALALKLQTTPQKKPNLIRSPFKQFVQASENILDRLKAIQDIQYDHVLKQKELKKKILQKRSICKFTKSIKSTQISPTKSSSTVLNEQNPQFPNFKSFQNFKTQSLPQIRTSNNNKIKVKAKFLNLKLVTNFQKKDDKPLRYSIDVQNNINLLNKRDLIEQTKKVKDQVYSMQTLSFYEVQKMKKKRLSIKNTIQ